MDMDYYEGIEGFVSQGSQELYLRVRRSGPETTIGAVNASEGSELLVRIVVTVTLKNS